MKFHNQPEQKPAEQNEKADVHFFRSDKLKTGSRNKEGHLKNSHKSDRHLRLEVRLVIFSACALIFVISCFFVYRHYDPLARYPFGTEEERKVMVEALDSDEINYLIDSQLQPGVFMAYLSVPEFEMENALYYYNADSSRHADAAAVVDFVNRYKDRFTLNNISEYLKFYTYNDLMEFFESGSKAVLSSSPDDRNLILNDQNSVYTYQPFDLTICDDGITLRSEAAEQWQLMRNAASLDGVDLEAAWGYVSYLQQKTMNQDSYVHSDLPYGSREEQLGFSVMLIQAAGWQQLMENGIQPVLSETDSRIISWLNDHAWEYGFVVRYPKGKEEITAHVENPYILRYTGKETAAKLREQNQVLEELYGI